MSIALPDWLRSPLFHALRLAFRLTPMSEGTRDRLRNRFLDRYVHLLPDTPRGQAPADTQAARRPRFHAGAAAIGYVPHRSGALPAMLPARLIAFYLPQFHPIPENDVWWGTGFTEWRNVARALPQFEGHAQPRLPADLGFYDLRNPQVMHQQAALAREYGISGFCFYFYWFAGRTLLERPLQQWLADPALDMPLCLCWANEKWARNWDGRGSDILIDQHHSAEDDLAFIAHIASYLRDPRYLRVDGKPLVLVYRPGLLPDIAATAARWRRWCQDHGIGEIHLAYVQGFERPDPRTIGFDAAVEFPPNLADPTSLIACQRLINPDYRGQVMDWRELAHEVGERPLPDYPLYPGVNPGWDNEPRRSGNGRTYLHASPRGYRDWLRNTIQRRLARVPADQRLIFINAWNEWAEGAVLEPDARLGHAWLDATRQALTPVSVPPPQPCAVIHAWYPEALDDILATLQATELDWRLVVTTASEKEREVREQLQICGLHWELECMENRGRDILPFLHTADRLLGEGVDVVLKLHTKRSIHRKDGNQWRQELLDRLASSARARAILDHFKSEPELGLVAPEGHLVRLMDHSGANLETLIHLSARLGIAAPSATRDERFISGSMFWARLDALRPLLDAHLSPWEFEEETGQVDGTFAHAIERVFTLAAQHAKYRVCTAASVMGEPEPAQAPYAYARKG